MESHTRTKPPKRSSEENRKRKRNLVIRFNDSEREMLDRVASDRSMTVSELVRYLVRREDEKAARQRPRI
jgi:hypothetical protein